MAYERMEFPEAVETLAKKAGVVLPQTDFADNKVSGLITQIYKINEVAGAFYANKLFASEGQVAKAYLYNRGIKEETIRKFKLGFAPDSWDALINHLRKANFSLSLIEKAGLLVSKEGGGYYDRFRKRIIFPIFDIKSRPIAFGARAVDDSLPKYINSPETLIYTKGKNLYGLSAAKEKIKEEDFIVLVEGYLDFILPYQEGLGNIVASSGTALTVEQARLLKRYTSNVVVVFDGDTAGELAALRSLDIFLEEQMQVRVVSLPAGLDPDSFVRKNGMAAFREKISQSEELFDYKLRVLESRFSGKDIMAKAKICAGMLETINKFKNAVLKSEYIKRLAQKLQVKEEALLEEAGKLNQAPALNLSVITPGKKPLAINPTEKLLIKLMLEEAELISRIRENLEPGDFHDERAARIVSVMFELASQGKDIQPHFLINACGDDDISQLICESMFVAEDTSSQHKERLVDDCIRRLKLQNSRLKRQHLQERIAVVQSSGDEATLQKLIEEFHNLIKKE
jgi:DNA primase